MDTSKADEARAPRDSEQPKEERTGGSSWVQKRGPGFFFWLNLFYLVLLLLLPLFRAADLLFVGPDRIPDPIGGLIPVGVPWFGALGATMISLYGVFDHNDAWDPRWNFWHMARPVSGVILGTMAYLIFIAFINATGATPTTGSEPVAGALPARDLIPYYVLAFLVGFREHTFRELIQRAADVLLGPGGTRETPATGVAVSPSPIRFETTIVGQEAEVIVSVHNSGTGDLIFPPAAAEPRGIQLEGDAFSIVEDAVSGAEISPNSSANLRIIFKPLEVREYSGVLRITSSAGKRSIQIVGVGRAADGPT